MGILDFNFSKVKDSPSIFLYYFTLCGSLNRMDCDVNFLNIMICLTDDIEHLLLYTFHGSRIVVCNTQGHIKI